jgi:integrase
MIEQTTMNLDNNTMDMTSNPFIQQMIQSAVKAGIQAGMQAKPQCKGDNILFTNFAEEWFKSRKDVRPTTLAKNRINYDKHIKPALTGKTLTQVTVPIVQTLFDSLHLKPATLKIIKSVLNMIMTWADGRDLIDKNPMPFIKIPKGESNHKRALTKEEITRLLDATKNERMWIIPYLCIATGMRPEELLGLKWANINLDEQYLFIDETFTIDCYSHTHIGEPKTKGSRRYIAIDSQIVALLKRYKAEQTKRYGVRTYVLNNRSEDRQVNPSTLRDKIVLWRDKAKIPDLCGYMFRHTSATVAYEAGVPLLTIARQFGHTTTKLLETVYVHQTTTKDQKDCALKVSNVIFEQQKNSTLVRA